MGNYSEMVDFTGKNVIVTGGLSGAGRQIAEVFIESGANVIVTYRSSGEVLGDLRAKYPGSDIRAFQLDQSDMSSIGTFVEELERCFGGSGSLGGSGSIGSSGGLGGEKGTSVIDVLVNNAGIYPAKSIEDIEADDWDDMMDTNARGVFFLSKEIRRFMKRGSIINISSINATNPARMLAHYGASKAAVEMITKSLAQEFGPDIRVNCIAPGLIYKEGQDEFIPGWADSYRERSPLGRLVTAEEIGRICLFLGSDLSSVLTGQVITADCGVLLAPAFYNEL